MPTLDFFDRNGKKERLKGAMKEFMKNSEYDMTCKFIRKKFIKN